RGLVPVHTRPTKTTVPTTRPTRPRARLAEAPRRCGLAYAVAVMDGPPSRLGPHPFSPRRDNVLPVGPQRLVLSIVLQVDRELTDPEGPQRVELGKMLVD